MASPGKTWAQRSPVPKPISVTDSVEADLVTWDDCTIHDVVSAETEDSPGPPAPLPPRQLTAELAFLSVEELDQEV